MTLLRQLSSQSGDRTEEANREVAGQCLIEPALLAEIDAGLDSPDAALVGDCAEVFTLVADARPEWVAPYAPRLVALLTHKTTRVRWEATHALALVAALVPDVITPLLHQLAEALRHDKSTIVRDYTVEIVAHYAKTGVEAARAAMPLLQEALTLWDGKHAARALNSLGHVAERLPSRAADIHHIAQAYLNHPRGVARKAAKRLAKQTAEILNDVHSSPLD